MRIGPSAGRHRGKENEGQDQLPKGRVSGR